MTPVNALIRKELRCFFVSPVFYVIGAVFLFIAGFLAHLTVVNATQQAVRLMQIQNTYAQLNLNDLVFRPFFFGLDIVLMFVLPMLTMRLFAEEKKLGTFELLLTSPIGMNEIVSAKFLSVLLLCTFPRSPRSMLKSSGTSRIRFEASAINSGTSVWVSAFWKVIV